MSSPGRLWRRLAETTTAYTHVVRAECAWPSARSGPPPSDRHFLLLAEWLPPDRIMGGSYRPTSFLQHSGTNRWRATAITRELLEPPDPAALALATRIPEDCLVVRVPPPSYQASPRVFPSMDGTVEAALEVAHRGARRLRGDPPSVVVATGPPFHHFLAAFYLSRRFGCKLVLDYRDEWTESPFAFVSSGRWDRVLEARILRRADGVLYTTRSQLEHALPRFRGLRAEKCFILPNGWDPPEATEDAPTTQPAARDPSRTVLSFVGNLGSHTHPGPFLDMLEQLVPTRPELADRLRLRLVGRIGEAVQPRLDRFTHPAMVERVGLVPLPEAKREMSDADALVIFAGSDLARYLPGKLFEYLAAKRPIMIYGEPGEASELVSSLSAGSRVAGPGEFLSFLDGVSAFQPGGAGSKIEEWLAGHRRDVLAERFFDILGRVSDRQDDGDR